MRIVPPGEDREEVVLIVVRMMGETYPEMMNRCVAETASGPQCSRAADAEPLVAPKVPLCRQHRRIWDREHPEVET